MFWQNEREGRTVKPFVHSASIPFQVERANHVAKAHDRALSKGRPCGRLAHSAFLGAQEKD